MSYHHAIFLRNRSLTAFLHIALVSISSLGIFYYVKYTEQQTASEYLQQYTQQVQALLTRQAKIWQDKAALLAQQPDLNSDTISKAVIPADGTVPPSLDYADQDLLNRTKTTSTMPEFNGKQDKTTVSIAHPAMMGGFIILQWPAKPLFEDLKAVTPAEIEIKLSQQLPNNQSMDVFRIHTNGNDGLLKPVPLSIQGWQLQIAYHPATIQTALWLAAFSFLIGLISLLLWIRQTRPLQNNAGFKPSTIENQPSDLSTPNTSTLCVSEPTEKATESDNLDVAATSITSSIPDVYQTMTESQHTQNNILEFSVADAIQPDADIQPTFPAFPEHLFRAYDIRGKVSDLTPSLIKHIAHALGATLRDRGQYQVVVGYDARSTSDHYAQITRQALIESGLSVVDIGRVPTPLMYFAARQHDKNGIMITASHNPSDENGIKWWIAGQAPSPDDIEQLKQRTIQQNFIAGLGRSFEHPYDQNYLLWLKHDVSLSKSFRVAVDGMHGSMGDLALEALTAAGCETYALHATPSGDFPYGAPDPSKAKNLAELKQVIAHNHCHMGFAFDGDGDRVVVLNHQGEVVSPDQLISLFAKIALHSRPGSGIICDVKCSRMVLTTITQEGGHPIMIRTGNTFLRTALLDPNNNAVFAGEFAGHYFFNDNRGDGRDDGLYVALRLLEWLDQQDQTLEEALEQLPSHVGTEDMYLPLEELDDKQLLQQLQADAEQIQDVKISLIDGIRLDFERGFGIIRSSNTGAYLTARFDADSAADLDHIRAVFSNLLAKYDQRLAQLVLEHA